MKFLGLQVGSWADWFSGIATTVGILITLVFSLKKGKFQFKLSVSPHDYQKNRELMYSIINHSSFDVKVQMISLSFRDHRFEQTEFTKYTEIGSRIDTQRRHQKNFEETLKVNELRSRFLNLTAMINAADQIDDIPFEPEPTNFNINEVEKRKSFYVVLEFLAQDGNFYRSRPKKIKLKDIT